MDERRDLLQQAIEGLDLAKHHRERLLKRIGELELQIDGELQELGKAENNEIRLLLYRLDECRIGREKDTKNLKKIIDGIGKASAIGTLVYFLISTNEDVLGQDPISLITSEDARPVRLMICLWYILRTLPEFGEALYKLRAEDETLARIAKIMSKKDTLS